MRPTPELIKFLSCALAGSLGWIILDLSKPIHIYTYLFLNKLRLLTMLGFIGHGRLSSLGLFTSFIDTRAKSKVTVKT